MRNGEAWAESKVQICRFDTRSLAYTRLDRYQIIVILTDAKILVSTQRFRTQQHSRHIPLDGPQHHN